MKQDKRFNQLQNQTQRGLFGDNAIIDSLKYEELSGNSVEISLKTINDFYSKEINQIFKPYPLALIEIILTLFFKNNEPNTELSDYFALIFQRNIEGTKNTSIKDKYLNMLNAAHAWKQSIDSKNPLIVWELGKNFFLAYNEFLNILLGVILINYRFSIGKTYKLNTLDNNYGNKVNELIELNPQEKPYKYLIELLKPEIRNAIGHQTIWYDEDDRLVTYINDKTGNDEAMGIEEFIFLNSKASYLGEAYLVALATIVIYTVGNWQDKLKLPKELFLLLMDIIPMKK
jgi:hypothetical protein